MHLGNVYAALLSWLSVKSQDGKWILRIEDIDTQRSKVEYADQIRRDLEWLGLPWDEEYVQSERFDIYEQHLKLLKDKDVTYPCYCTRADILATQAPHESDGRVVYAGTCRNRPSLGEDVPAAIRLMVPDEDISFVDTHYGINKVNLATHCGDFILRRKDGAWAYQLAVVVDDALMGVTEVVRGRDLLLSAPQQIFLHRMFGYNPPTFAHLPLLINEQGQRLSKRDKSLDLGELRKHYDAEELIGLLAYHAGLQPDKSPVSAEKLTSVFCWDKVPNEDVIVKFA